MFNVTIIQTMKDDSKARSFNSFETLAEAKSSFYLELGQITVSENLKKVVAEIEDDEALARLNYGVNELL